MEAKVQESSNDPDDATTTTPNGNGSEIKASTSSSQNEDKSFWELSQAELISRVLIKLIKKLISHC
jgi:hypothetical protein